MRKNLILIISMLCSLNTYSVDLAGRVYYHEDLMRTLCITFMDTSCCTIIQSFKSSQISEEFRSRQVTCNYFVTRDTAILTDSSSTVLFFRIHFQPIHSSYTSETDSTYFVLPQEQLDKIDCYYGTYSSDVFPDGSPQQEIAFPRRPVRKFSESYGVFMNPYSSSAVLLSDNHLSCHYDGQDRPDCYCWCVRKNSSKIPAPSLHKRLAGKLPKKSICIRKPEKAKLKKSDILGKTFTCNDYRTSAFSFVNDSIVQYQQSFPITSHFGCQMITEVCKYRICDNLIYLVGDSTAEACRMPDEALNIMAKDTLRVFDKRIGDLRTFYRSDTDGYINRIGNEVLLYQDGRIYYSKIITFDGKAFKHVFLVFTDSAKRHFVKPQLTLFDVPLNF